MEHEKPRGQRAESQAQEDLFSVTLGRTFRSGLPWRHLLGHASDNELLRQPEGKEKQSGSQKESLKKGFKVSTTLFGIKEPEKCEGIF